MSSRIRERDALVLGLTLAAGIGIACNDLTVPAARESPISIPSPRGPHLDDHPGDAQAHAWSTAAEGANGSSNYSVIRTAHRSGRLGRTRMAIRSTIRPNGRIT